VLLALFWVALLLPEFNAITGKNLSLRFDATLILALLGITLFTGLLAGSYPAVYLSGFHPAMVLKGKINSALGELWARKGLVVFQFTLSIIFIVGFLVIHKQIDYTQTKNLGYNRDNIVCFSRQGAMDSKDYPAFIAELRNIPGVVNATGMARSILKDIGIRSGFSWEGQAKSEKEMSFPSPQISHDFIQTLGIELKEGRAFSAEFAEEKSKIIVNEAAVEMIGFNDPIGKTIKYGEEEMQIIGVVKNFHYGSLHNPIEPLLFMYATRPDNILVKIQAGTEKVTLAQIKRVYEKFHPKYIFEFTFLDADYQTLYDSENKIASLLKYFTFLAILISCLGLFGLAAFTAERRRKEIGVRKILGASRFSIMYLLSGDFTKLVLVAICLSLPLSYLVVKHWLNNFEYRIALEWWYFIGAGLTALLIAWLTVSAQAVKAASVNPALSLKEE
jgi:ABC-type antimicrobial peptide transport system permease subunit